MANEKTRITTFGKFFLDSMQSEGISDRYVTNRENLIKDAKASNEVVPECRGRHIISRSNWLNALKENKSESIIDQVPTDELPECEDFEKSKVGDFLSKKSFDVFDDEGTIWEELEDNGVMCYNSVSGNQTWWKVRKDNKSSKDGLVRIK